MKIALIGRYGEGEILNGPERVARELNKELKQKKLNVTFIEYFFSGYSNYSLLRKIFGKNIIEDNVQRLGALQIVIKLLKEKFDIIHFINSQRFQLIIFFLKPFLKAKIISSFHGFIKDEIKLTGNRRPFLDFRVENLLVNKSNILIFPSNLLADKFRKNYTILENKIRIIPNGVDEIFKNKKAVNDFKNPYNFVYYNSFNVGLNELINEIPENLNLKLFVIGDRKSTVQKKIIFVNPMDRNSLIDFLSDKHFVIKSSAFDSFSIFVGECMSLGIIPVVSENTGIKEIIKNKINGFIYDSRKKGSLSDLLNNIFNDKHDLNLISKNSSDIYLTLNWRFITNHYIVTYKSVL